jgi:hypothetical protein
MESQAAELSDSAGESDRDASRKSSSRYREITDAILRMGCRDLLATLLSRASLARLWDATKSHVVFE